MDISQREPGIRFGEGCGELARYRTNVHQDVVLNAVDPIGIALQRCVQTRELCDKERIELTLMR